MDQPFEMSCMTIRNCQGRNGPIAHRLMIKRTNIDSLVEKHEALVLPNYFIRICENVLAHIGKHISSFDSSRSGAC